MGWGTGNLGGGSAGLNFKIVGGTNEPSSPKANTIWVNTDQKITGYILSATEPETPEEGMVLITIGTDSAVAFSVTKKNPVMVYPISAKQYVSGAWVDVTAKSYQNGEWVDWWNGELYEPGNMHEMHTGGWVKGEGIAGSTVTFGDTGIVLATGSGTRIHAETAQKVEFGQYKTIKAVIEVTAATTASVVRLGYSSAPGTSLASSTTKSELKPGGTGELTISLDISGAPGSAYVVIGAGYSSTTFIVKEVKME